MTYGDIKCNFLMVLRFLIIIIMNVNYVMIYINYWKKIFLFIERIIERKKIFFQ